MKNFVFEPRRVLQPLCLLLASLALSPAQADVSLPAVSATAFLETQLEQTRGTLLFEDLIIHSISGDLTGSTFFIASPDDNDEFYLDFNPLVDDYTFNEQTGEVFRGNVLAATVTGFGDSALASFTIEFTSDVTTSFMLQSILRGVSIKNTSATAVDERLLTAKFIATDSKATVVFNQLSINGPFASHDLNLAAVSGRKVAEFADLTGDGIEELLVGLASGQLDFYDNQGTLGNANFVVADTNPFAGISVTSNAYPAFVDIDGDLDMDLFVAEQAGTVSFYQNTGNANSATFVLQNPAQNPLSTVDVGEYASIDFADLDNDGDQDLLIGNDTGLVNYFENTGTSNNPIFTEQTGINNPAAAIDVLSNASVRLMDIDRDFDLDLFVGNEAGEVEFWRNDGSISSPVFARQIGTENPFTGQTLGRFITLSFADVNNDGTGDVFVGNEDSEFLHFQNTSKILLQVTAENDAPQINGDTNISVAENTTSVAQLSFYDEEGSPLAASLSGDDSSLFNIDNNGVLSLVNSANFEQPIDQDGNNAYQVTVTVEDDANATTSVDFTVSVTDVNEAPIIDGQSVYNLEENTRLIGNLQISDEDQGDSVSIQLLGDDADKVSIDGGGNLTFDDLPDFEFPSDRNSDNQYSFVVFVQDSQFELEELAIVVNIQNSLEQIVINGIDDINVDENEVTGGAQQALFESISLVDIGDDFSGYQLQISGLDDNDNLFISDASGALLLTGNEVRLNGELVATIDNVSNGESGSDLIINFESEVDYASLEALLRSLQFTSDDANPQPQRLLPITLWSPQGQNVGIFSHSEFELQNAVTAPFVGQDFGDNSRPVLADIDGDNDYDAFIANDSTVLYFENQGSTLAEDLVQIPSQHSPLNGITFSAQPAPFFVDIDKDLDLDLFIAYGDGSVDYYLNQGNKSEANFVLQSSGNNPLSGVSVANNAQLAFVDIDFDLDLDLFVADAAGVLHYFENTGDNATPTFVERTGNSNPLQTINVGNNASIAFIDLEQDGDQDLFIGHSAGQVEYVRNSGTKLLAQFQLQSSNLNPLNRIAVAGNATPYFVDLDSDGDQDLVLGEANGSVQYWLNNSGLLINIAAVNDVPDIVGESQLSLPENTSVVANYDISDEEGDDFVVSLSGDDAALFSIDSAGQLQFVAPPDFENPTDADSNNQYLVTILAQDGNSSPAQLAITIDIFGTEEITINGDAEYQVVENARFVANLQVIDEEGDELTLNKQGDDSALFILEQSGQLSFIEAPNFEHPFDANEDGEYQITIRATDSKGNFNTLDITVLVTNENEAPSINGSEMYSIFENTNRVAFFTGFDEDTVNSSSNEALRYELAGVDADLFTISELGVLAFTDAPNFESPQDADGDNLHQVTVRILDAMDLADELQVSVSVTNIEELTINTDSALTVLETELLVTTFDVVDEEGDAITLTLTGDDAAMFDIQDTGELQFVEPANYEVPNDFDRNNIYQITMTATDAKNDFVSKDFTVELIEVNEAPHISGEPQFEIFESETFSSNFTVTDDENDALSFGLSGEDANLFTLTLNGLLTFNAIADFEAPLDSDGDNHYQVSIDATDIEGNASSLAISLWVLNKEEPTHVSLVSNITLVEEAVTAGESAALLPEIELTDPDNSAACFVIKAQGVMSEDFVTIVDNPSELVTVLTDSGEVFVAGQLVANIDSQANGKQMDLVVQFVDLATPEQAQAVLRSLSFSTTQEVPDKTRSLLVTIEDANGQTSFINNGQSFALDSTGLNPIETLGLSAGSQVTFGVLAESELADLLVGDAEGNIQFYQNQGSTSVPSYVLMDAEASPFGNLDVGTMAVPRLVDLDDDNDLDLVVANGSGFISYFENQTTIDGLQFSQLRGLDNPFNGIDVGENAKSWLVDLDNDLDMDLVLLAQDRVARVYTNIGSKVQAEFQLMDQSPIPESLDGLLQSVSLEDIDGDNDFDLIALIEDGQLQYLQNQGNAEQALFIIAGEGDNPFVAFNQETNFASEFIDIDGDLDRDLLLLAQDGSSQLVVNHSALTFNIVSPNNLAPVIDLETQVDLVSGKNLLLTAVVTDNEDDPLTYTWRQLSGITVTLTNNDSDELAFVAPEVSTQQELIFELLVEDGRNQVSKQVTIQLYPQGAEIPGRFTPEIAVNDTLTVTEGSIVNLTAVVTDADGDELSISWSQLTGPDVELTNSDTATPSFTAPEVTEDQTVVLVIEVSDGFFQVQETVSINITDIPVVTPEPEPESEPEDEKDLLGLAWQGYWLLFALLLRRMATYQRTKPG